MPRRTIAIFFLVCFFTGICIFLGSVFGNVLGERGLIGGALAGGVLGVLASVRMAIRPRWLDPDAFGKASLLGIVGFLLAAAIAVPNLGRPLILILSVGLVGLGVLSGREWARRSRSGPFLNNSDPDFP